MQHFADSFALLPAAQRILDELRTTEPEFAHLHRATITAIASQRVILDRGSVCRALVVKPAQLTGKAIERVFHEWAIAQVCRPLLAGELPDFAVYFDLALWNGDDSVSREQLCFHELLHVDQKRDSYGAPKFERDGKPMLRLVAHDAEVFFSELRRYGRVVPAFDDTALAIAIGARTAKRRTLKRA